MTQNKKNVEDRFFLELSIHLKKENKLSFNTIQVLFPNMNEKAIAINLYSLIQQGKLYKTDDGDYSLKKINEDLFFNDLSKHLENINEMAIKKIYSLFPKINKKTISWRLYSLVKQGKLFRTGPGTYSLKGKKENMAAGYTYLQKKSKNIYDILIEYGYDFYISGLDSLVGEILHIPENFPTLLVVERADAYEVSDILNEENLFIISESDRVLLKNENFKNRIDAILLYGKDFNLALEHIALKEKGFVDLYFSTTRLEYGFPVLELSRIYDSLLRNGSITNRTLIKAGRDRKISDDINWLAQLNNASKKTLAFMNYRMKGDKE